MTLFNKLGPRHMQMVTSWLPTATLYGASLGLAGMFFTDFKTVLRYVPFYGSKYPPPEE